MELDTICQHMAGPITHIVLANKVFQHYFPDKEKRSFFIGTSFPDIRYLGVIKRDITHSSISSIKQITSQSSFQAGFEFHSLVDQVREQFVSFQGVYDLVPSSRYITQAIKFMEDDYFYSHIDNWRSIIDYFDIILKEELQFGIEEKDIMRWHQILQMYCQSQPNRDSLSRFIKETIQNQEVADGINKIVSEIKEEAKIKKIISDFYTEFNRLIST